MSERMKHCRGCDATKPWSEFYARTKWDDGSMRNPHTLCKTCSKAHRVALKHAEPEERKAARADRQRAYLRSLPEVQKERYRERHRITNAEFRRANGLVDVSVPYRPNRVRDTEADRMLPIGPFRAWLAEQLESRPAGILADALGVRERTMWRWMNENRVVAMDTVDKVFCRAHEPYLLRELYPDLYEFGDDEQVAA